MKGLLLLSYLLYFFYRFLRRRSLKDAAWSYKIYELGNYYIVKGFDDIMKGFDLKLYSFEENIILKI